MAVKRANDIHRKILKEIRKLRKVGVETRRLSLQLYFKLRRIAKLEFLDEQVAELRAVKDAGEIAALEKAASIAVEGMRTAVEFIRPGVREVEVAGEVERALRRAGAEGYPYCEDHTFFNTIVLSGPRAAYPHGKPSDRTIRRGDVVIVDLGARWHGYCANMTRTIIIGDNRRWKRALKAVIEASRAAMQKAMTGVMCKQLYYEAKKVLTRYRLASYFVHGLGHGIGLEVHEKPFLNQYSRDSLKEGMVFTIEPGVYIKGLGGIRVEDMVVVTRKGVKVLTEFPRELS